MQRPIRVDLRVHTTASRPVPGSHRPSEALRSSPRSTIDPLDLPGLLPPAGIDYVAVTDRDTIDGALRIADDPRVLIGEEISAWHPTLGRPLTIVALGVSRVDHAMIQRVRGDARDLVDYLRGRDLVHFLAAPLHARREPFRVGEVHALLALVPLWETLCASAPAEENALAARLAAGVGASDAWAAGDVGRAVTLVPPSATREDVLAHLRAGRGEPDGASASMRSSSARAYAHVRASLKASGGDPRRTWFARAREIAQWVLRTQRETELRGRVERALLALGANRVLARPLPALVALATRRGMRRMDPWRALTAMQAACHDQQRFASTAYATLLRARTAAVAHGSRLNAARRAITAAMAYASFELPAAAAAGALATRRRRAAALADTMIAPPHAGGRRRPRVAVLVDALDHLNGVSTTYRALGPAFAESGLDATIIACHADPGAVGPGPLVLPPVLEVPAPYYTDFVGRFPALADLLDVLDDLQVDVLHVATPGPLGTCGILAARLLDLPLVSCYHTEVPEYAVLLSNGRLKEGLMWRAVRVFYGQSQLVLAPSHATLAQLAAHGLDGHKLALFPQGVNARRFTPEKRRADFWPARGLRTRSVLLYVGRLSVEKGLDTLFEAFAAIRSTHPDVGLALVGEGPSRELLDARAPEGVVFTGRLDGEDLAQAFASADVFAFPSTTDTFGLVVLEALASGLPAVVTDVGGPREIVRHEETGLVVRGGDARALADACARLLDVPGLAREMGANAREAAAALDWSVAARRLEDTYTHLAGDRLREASPRPAPAPASLPAAASRGASAIVPTR